MALSPTVFVMEPFGEYVRRTMDLDPDDPLALIVCCCSSLYIFRTDPDRLKQVVEEWHNVSEDPSNSDDFSGYALGMIQQCVEKYFAVNWDKQAKIVEINREYKKYTDEILAECLECRKKLTSPQGPQSSPTKWRCMQRPARCPVEGRFPLATKESLSELRRVHSQTGVVVVFHAAFSDLSCHLLGELERIECEVAKRTATPPLFCLVNCAREICLLHKFNISWYPTIVFLEEGTHKTYPEQGSGAVEALAEWISSRGTAPVKSFHKLRKMLTKVLKLQARLKYCGIRELRSAIWMLKQLQSSAPSAKLQPDGPPVFIFLGGGMTAGKTTAVTALTRSEWWERNGTNTVIVDADAFKQIDPLKLTSSDVHEESLKHAGQLLVAAINQGRNIIFDGTMTWEPYVTQTVEMVHRCTTVEYKCGRGYKPEDGIEEYWVPVSDRAVPLPHAYQIRLIAITLDPETAVPRAVLRYLSTGRSVPVRSQLRSFKMFSNNFNKYASLCDDVVLYNNNIWIDLANGELPKVCAHKHLGESDLTVDDTPAFLNFERQKELDENAPCADALYPKKAS